MRHHRAMRKTLLPAVVLAACGSAAKPDATGPAPTVSATPTAEVPTTAMHGDPLDPSAVPAGHGWTCYSTAPSMQCFRAAADCDAARSAELDRAAAEAEDPIVYSECLALAEVTASTARDIKTGVVDLMFWTNPETCEIDGSYYRNDNPYYDRGSGCATLP